MNYKSKYDIGIYRFGEIFEKIFINNDLSDSYWSYKMKKAGNSYSFWYAEEELERLEKELLKSE